MFRTVCICGDKRQIDLRTRHSGELDLGFFSRFLESLKRHFILAEIYPSVFLRKCICDPVYNAFVKIISAETVVSGSCKYFKYAVAYFEERNVESTSAEVVNHYLLIYFLIQSVCESRRRRLVYNTQNFKSGNFSGVLCRLTLRVREVCRYGNYSLVYLCSEKRFGIRFHLLKYHRGNFLRRICLVIYIYLEICTHFAFD